MSKKDDAEESSAEEQLAAEEKAANSIKLPPVVCHLHPRGLIIARETSEEVFDEIALALARGTKQPWYIADLCQHRIAEGHAGVYRWAERQGLGRTDGLRTMKMTALRFSLPYRTVPLPFTCYRIVATDLDDFPSEEELGTTVGAEKATEWRQRGVEILEYALAMAMTTKELTAYLREIQGKPVQPSLSFLKNLIKQLHRVAATPALLAALPATAEVTALMTLLAGLLGHCLEVVNAFLSQVHE